MALAAVLVAAAACAPVPPHPSSGQTVTEGPTSQMPAPPWWAPPSPEAAPTPATAAPMAASVPVRVVVPAIGVDSPLMNLGLNADGTMQVPPTAFPAGWYTGAPTPGERGPAVIAGHVDLNGAHAVFHDLAALRVGDTVTVARADGSVATFRITAVQQYPKDAFPTDAVYGDTAGPELRLITCGGDFNRATGHFVDNIVVYAAMEPALPAP